MAVAEHAAAAGDAFGAALVVNEGMQTLTRVGSGGYARINLATQLWAEEGEMMPGVARHNRVIPFLADTPVLQATVDILIVGGRTFILDLTVYDDDGDVQDITGAAFVAQLRRYRYSKYPVASMGYQILNGPTGQLRLIIDADTTSHIVRCMVKGVWDLEMQLGGIESTVVPESKVRVTPGISQGSLISAGSGSASGQALGASSA